MRPPHPNPLLPRGRRGRNQERCQDALKKGFPRVTILTSSVASRTLLDPMAEPKENPLMEKIVSLCKRRGFIFQSSEIYGGINGFWDYGPLGAELKRNVKELWWNTMTRQREDVAGLEATIIMSPEIWKASGHVATFSDPMIDCKTCKGRFRADQINEIPCLQKPSKT